jgi:hypothetical protein
MFGLAGQVTLIRGSAPSMSWGSPSSSPECSLSGGPLLGGSVLIEGDQRRFTLLGTLKIASLTFPILIV